MTVAVIVVASILAVWLLAGFALWWGGWLTCDDEEGS